MSKEHVIVWWNSASDPESWCVDLLLKNSNGQYEHLLDSGSEDFPIDVDAFGPFEEDLLIQSLKNSFPLAQIILKF